MQPAIPTKGLTRPFDAFAGTPHISGGMCQRVDLPSVHRFFKSNWSWFRVQNSDPAPQRYIKILHDEKAWKNLYPKKMVG